jgi:hypothetical protein
MSLEHTAAKEFDLYEELARLRKAAAEGCEGLGEYRSCDDNTTAFAKAMRALDAAVGVLTQLPSSDLLIPIEEALRGN